MSDFVCPKCDKEFERKYDFDRHCKTKNCSDGSKTNKSFQHKCNFCKKSYSRKDALVRHYKTCKTKAKQNIKNEGNDCITNSGKNGTLAAGDNNTVAGDKAIIGDNNTVTTTTTINNNVYVFFGKDGVKSLSHDDIVNILKSDRNLIESLICEINLDPKKPNHHNIYYGDTKSSYGEVYDEDNKWVKMKIHEIFNSLMDAKIEDLNGILNSMVTILNKKTQNKIRDVIARFDHTKLHARKKLIGYLKPILYNNREMILKTRENHNRIADAAESTSTTAKSTSKTAKKSTSKTAKKSTSKTAKKSNSKTARKSNSKTAKKSGSKTAKKSTSKTAKK